MPGGNRYEFNSWSSGAGTGEENRSAAEPYGRFETCFALPGYPYDIVFLSPAFSRTVTLGSPVEIQVK